MAAMFEHLVRVRWRDTDALGHVNHAVFLTYLEEGRDAFYVQALGSDPSYVVVRLEVDLRAEVRHPDQQVTVRIQAERLGTTSLTTRETILTAVGRSSGRGARRHGPLGRHPPAADAVQRDRAHATGGSHGRTTLVSAGETSCHRRVSHMVPPMPPRSGTAG